MKKNIKQIATFIWHPIVSIVLLLKGTRHFTILPQLTINCFHNITIGNHFYLGRNSRFLLISEYKGCSYEPGISIGNNVSIGNRFSALSAAPITIGDNALLASDILITSENHGMDPEQYESYSMNPLIAQPVTIGAGCWIGEKVIILPGVSLGDKCIVAAGSVVNKSFPPYTLIAGVPAKAIKTYSKEKHEWIHVSE